MYYYGCSSPKCCVSRPQMLLCMVALTLFRITILSQRRLMGKNAHRTKLFGSFHIVSFLLPLLPPLPLLYLVFSFSSTSLPVLSSFFPSLFFCITPQKFLNDTLWVKFERARLEIKRPQRTWKTSAETQVNIRLHPFWKTPSEGSQGFGTGVWGNPLDF